VNSIDKPGTDETEQYCYFSSPGVVTSADTKTYHAEVAYGWGAAQPLIMDFAISINLDSVPLDDRNYPQGHICDQCLLPMPYGTVAINVPTINGLGETLICIACARDAEWARWYTQPWEIDLSMIRTLLKMKILDDAIGEGNIKAWRGINDTLMFKLTGEDADGGSTYCFLNLAADRLESFLAEVDRYMGSSDMAAIESAFLDSALDELERLANGENL
jgi:hypothetical protein